MWKILKFNISQSIDNPWLYPSIHCVRSHLAFSHLVCSLLTSHLFKLYFNLLLVIELNQLRCPLHYGEGAWPWRYWNNLVLYICLALLQKRYSNKECLYDMLHFTFMWEIGFIHTKVEYRYEKKHFFVENIVAISLQRLGIENILSIIVEIYGVVKFSISIKKNGKKLCKLMWVDLKHIFFQLFQVKVDLGFWQMSLKYLYSLHYICNCWVTYSNSYSNNRWRGLLLLKSFHSSLLQGIINTKCVFGVYEFGGEGTFARMDCL